MNTLEKVREACRLMEFMPSNREFVSSMADIFCCRPLKEDGDNLALFLETIYNYGRVEGIRQERKRRKAVSV